MKLHGGIQDSIVVLLEVTQRSLTRLTRFRAHISVIVQSLFPCFVFRKKRLALSCPVKYERIRNLLEVRLSELLNLLASSDRPGILRAWTDNSNGDFSFVQTSPGIRLVQPNLVFPLRATTCAAQSNWLRKIYEHCLLLRLRASCRSSLQSIFVDIYRPSYRTSHLSSNELAQMSLLMDGVRDNEDKSVSIMKG